ncbi:unannotated protein [freshwater metagenome]|uniref:Unannotated protein n=1 Tax=freshwater metagenome TaxID=449393 RepID=A0A6J5YG89_9ZZZZ
MHRARGGFHHDGGFVAERLGYGMQLADMGDHPGGPAAARVAAEAALQARLDGTEGNAFAVSEVAAGARRAHRIDATGDATEHGLDDNASGTEVANGRC